MKFIRRHIKIITIVIIIVLILFFSFLKIYLNNNSKLEEVVVDKNEEVGEKDLVKEEDARKQELEKEIVFVDIKGAINNPGVYEIESDKKVIDVINLAGGLTDKADTSLINLAKQVTKEMVVIIYTKEEVERAKQEEPIIKIVEKECICPEIKNDACLEKEQENEEVNEEKVDVVDKKINLNKATLEELQTLEGIGESKAKAIIAYREEKGKFNNIEELLEVSGIGEKLYETIKTNITV